MRQVSCFLRFPPRISGAKHHNPNPIYTDRTFSRRVVIQLPPEHFQGGLLFNYHQRHFKDVFNNQPPAVRTFVDERNLQMTYYLIRTIKRI